MSHKNSLLLSLVVVDISQDVSNGIPGVPLLRGLK